MCMLTCSWWGVIDADGTLTVFAMTIVMHYVDVVAIGADLDELFHQSLPPSTAMGPNTQPINVGSDSPTNYRKTLRTRLCSHIFIVLNNNSHVEYRQGLQM